MTDQIHPNYLRCVETTPRPRPPRKTISQMSLWELWCSLWQPPAREQADNNSDPGHYWCGDETFTTAQQSADEDGDAG